LQSLTMAMASHALGSFYHLCQTLTSEKCCRRVYAHVPRSHRFFLFILTASYGQLDRIVDDGSSKMRSARIIALIAPLFVYSKRCNRGSGDIDYDDEFLYIHSKKEAKIPLAVLTYVHNTAELPYLLHESILCEILIHLCSDEYGRIDLDIDGFGSYEYIGYQNRNEVNNEILS